MSNRYSTQQLYQHLTEVISQIQQGKAIEITQEGETVAVILSVAEYQRLTAPKSSFWQSLQQFRQQTNIEELGIESDVFAGVRDITPGREVNF
jgi:prevent-host-death family protein